jgi:phage terminase large subunit-like protein
LLLKAWKLETERRRSTNRLAHYRPYAKQREFHAAGLTHSERLFMAGNQLGKTIAGGAEWAMHATGRYPDWWEGQTFDKPVILWASGVTSESTRDNPQRILVGNPPKEEQWGTGFIPKECLLDWDRAMGVPNLLDNVIVQWGGGGDVQAGESIVYFKSYEKGREKWQGPTIDGVWFDEESPLEIYVEGLTRTNNGQRSQFVIMTFTPLKGMSDVVAMFLGMNE